MCSNFTIFVRASAISKKTHLIKEAIQECAAKFGVRRETIWAAMKKQKSSKCSTIDVSSKISQKYGRKPKDWSDTLHRLREVPLCARQTMRILSFALGVPKTFFSGF